MLCRQLICRHEPLLSGTTDADKVFPNMKRNVTIDGEVFSGVFASDLTLAQVKMLRARQSNTQRDLQYDGIYRVRSRYCPL